MQVIRIFFVMSTFSDQVKDVIDGTPVHKAIRMQLFTGEHLLVGTPEAFF